MDRATIHAALDVLLDALEERAAPIDEWISLSGREMVPGYAVTARNVRDAARRGELDVSAGRPPRVLRSELGRWLASRRKTPRAPKPPKSDEYLSVIEGGRR